MHPALVKIALTGLVAGSLFVPAASTSGKAPQPPIVKPVVVTHVAPAALPTPVPQPVNVKATPTPAVVNVNKTTTTVDVAPAVVNQKPAATTMCKPVGGGVVDVEQVPADQQSSWASQGYYDCGGAAGNGYCTSTPQGTDCQPSPYGNKPTPFHPNPYIKADCDQQFAAGNIDFAEQCKQDTGYWPGQPAAAQ